MPLSRRHARKGGILVYPRIVDENLDCAAFEHGLERGARRPLQSHVEGDRLGRTAGREDVRRDAGRRVEVSMAMDVDKVPCRGEAAANRRADAAAAARHERAFTGIVHRCKVPAPLGAGASRPAICDRSTMVTRPEIKGTTSATAGDAASTEKS